MCTTVFQAPSAMRAALSGLVSTKKMTNATMTAVMPVFKFTSTPVLALILL